MKAVVATSSAPQAIGPYSQAVRAGDWLFLSGQIGLDPATGDLVAGGVIAETKRVLANLRAVLEAAGADLGDVVRTTIYLADLGDSRTSTRSTLDVSNNRTRPARQSGSPRSHAERASKSTRSHGLGKDRTAENVRGAGRRANACRRAGNHALRSTRYVSRSFARRRLDDFTGPDTAGAREHVAHGAVHVGVNGCRFGRHVRFVRLLAWLTLLPTENVCRTLRRFEPCHSLERRRS